MDTGTRWFSLVVAAAVVAGAVSACSDDDSHGNANNGNNNNETPALCGDGTVDADEECDDGAGNSDVAPDACRTSCRLPYCGDGVVDTGEACEPEASLDQTCADAGFAEGALSCDSTCRIDAGRCLGFSGVATGTHHTCGLRPDGAVRCWGRNELGQLGREDRSTSPTPAPVEGLPAVAQIAAGDGHTCALDSAGAVRCWGAGGSGQLGGGDTLDSPTPVTVVGITDASAIGAGESHTCAVRAGGGLACWGDNSLGQLGLGVADSDPHPDPEDVPGLTGVMEVTAGNAHSCALLGSGEVACWGSGQYGKLGNGSESESLTPAVVDGIPGIRSVSAGRYHTCAADVEGRAWCWGRNDDGHLGRGFVTTSELTPAPVEALSQVVSVAAGTNHSCALADDGRVWCWGNNTAGRLGNGTTVRSPLPVQVVGLTDVVALGALASQTCAVTADRRLFCWGYNGDGELGPAAPSDGDEPVAVSGLAGASALAVGHHHACAVQEHGTVACWGSGANGRLGDGYSQDRPAPSQVFGLMGATAIAAGAGHTCAVRSNEEVLCWGMGTVGQLGTGVLADSFLPAEVSWPDRPGGTTVTRLTAGSEHTCAALNDGSAWCWGRNSVYGQLGDGTRTTRTTPVRVSDTAFGGEGVIALSAGSYHTCAVLADGTAWCWGQNAWGKLGDGCGDTTCGHVVCSSSNCALTPSQVAAVANLPAFVDIAAGVNHTCAVGDDGTAWCWGRNWWGTLGRAGPDSATPVQVTGTWGTLSDAVGITMGNSHTCALREDETVACWGYELVGTLGAGTFASSNGVPMPMLGIAHAAELLAGYFFTCVRLTNGTVWCTGENPFGQLGDGTFARSTVPIEVPDVAR